MSYIHRMLNKLAKVYKIKYRILESFEEKGYSDDSPFLHARMVNNKTYLFDLSESEINREEFEKLLSFTLDIISDTFELCKNSSNMYTNTHDVLTDTYNREFFENKMRGLSNAVIITSDVNNLKVMNDVFGHAKGDKLLVTASSLLKKYAKENYIVARCGGDEFNIIIPDGTLSEAKEYCNKIQKECENYKGELHLRPQIAFGYAKQDKGEDAKDTLKRADDYMYRDKTRLKGSNNVISELEQKLYELGYADRDEMQNKLQLALSFGLYLNLPFGALSDLALAVKIEKIGMLAVPENIRFKTEPLTNEELNVVKKHPEVGFRLAKLDNSTLSIATTIYQCHECYDGSGYPCGIQGEQISYLARIIAIVTDYLKVYSKYKYMGTDAYTYTIDKIISMNTHDPTIKHQFLQFIKLNRNINEKGTGDFSDKKD